MCESCCPIEGVFACAWVPVFMCACVCVQVHDRAKERERERKSETERERSCQVVANKAKMIPLPGVFKNSACPVIFRADHWKETVSNEIQSSWNELLHLKLKWLLSHLDQGYGITVMSNLKMSLFRSHTSGPKKLVKAFFVRCAKILSPGFLEKMQKMKERWRSKNKTVGERKNTKKKNSSEFSNCHTPASNVGLWCW